MLNISPSDERILVIQAVMEDKLPASAITEQEIEWLTERLFEAIAEKHTSLPHYNYTMQ